MYRLADFVATVSAKEQRLGWLQQALAAFFAGETTPIRSVPTDGDELAEQEPQAPQRSRQAETQGGIGG